MKPAPASSTSVSASSATISAPVQRPHADAGRSRSAAFLQHLVDVGLRDVQRRREAEDDAGAEADRGKNAKTRRVHRELDPVRLADVGVARRRTGGCRRPRARGRATPLIDREQQAFDEQLTDDAPARRRRARRGRRSRATRCADRASSRLATLAHAISSTKPTAPISDRNTERIGPPLTRSLKVCTRGLDVLVGVGIVAGQALADGRPARRAPVAADTPSASRPKTSKLRASRFCLSRSRDQCAAAATGPRSAGNLKPSGMTPMTIAGTSLTRIVRPMTAGSLP